MKNIRKSSIRYDTDEDYDNQNNQYQEKIINKSQGKSNNSIPNLPNSQKFNNLKAHNNPYNNPYNYEEENEIENNQIDNLADLDYLSNKKSEVIDYELDCTNKFMNLSQFEQSQNPQNLNLLARNQIKNQNIGQFGNNNNNNSQENKYKEALINYEKIQKFKIMKEDYDNIREKDKNFNSPLSSLDKNDKNQNKIKGKSSYFDDIDTELKNNEKNNFITGNNKDNVDYNTKKEGEFGYKRDDSLLKINNKDNYFQHNFQFTENDNIDFESEAYTGNINNNMNKQINKIESEAFLVIKLFFFIYL